MASELDEVSPPEVRERILEALRGLRFGSVEVQVHDSKIVRITRTEKVRVETLNGQSNGAVRSR